MNSAWVGVIGVVIGIALSGVLAIINRLLDTKDRTELFVREDELRREVLKREDDRRYLDERKALYAEWFSAANRNYRAQLDYWMAREANAVRTEQLNDVDASIRALVTVIEKTTFLVPTPVSQALRRSFDIAYKYHDNYDNLDWRTAAMETAKGMSDTQAACRADIGIAAD